MPIHRVWRPFTENKIKAVPEKPGVYEIGGAKEDVVYIGSSTSSLRERLLSHKEKRKFVRTKYFRYVVLEWPNKPVSNEHKLCELYKKKHNGKLPRLQERSPRNYPF